ncbi:hypothetical protein GDO78_002962 [Eleutherodactylus coqui]|uniref:Uncharacterized protein n=1 Tax=Eleutherodactylus coqui TaxID=57060 RepID=A0A8J6EVH8_ELECQ|nr:hypothetical protein GDO78_002962 [Eleutherodactylus coqui]
MDYILGYIYVHSVEQRKKTPLPHMQFFCKKHTKVMLLMARRYSRGFSLMQSGYMKSNGFFDRQILRQVGGFCRLFAIKVFSIFFCLYIQIPFTMDFIRFNE